MEVEGCRKVIKRELADEAEMSGRFEYIPHAAVIEAANFNIDKTGFAQQSLKHELAEKADMHAVESVDTRIFGFRRYLRAQESHKSPGVIAEIRDRGHQHTTWFQDPGH